MRLLGINLVRNFYELGVLQSVSDLNKEVTLKLREFLKTLTFKKIIKI